MIIPRTADLLVGMNATEGFRNLGFLRPGGRFVINASGLGVLPAPARRFLEEQRIRTSCYNADGYALSVQKPLTANLYAIGYLSVLPEVPFDSSELRAQVQRLSKPAFLNDNLLAFDKGCEEARSTLGETHGVRRPESTDPVPQPADAAAGRGSRA